MPKIYFDTTWGTAREFLEDLRKQTPNSSTRWNNLEATLTPAKAEFHIGFDSPSNMVDSERLLLFNAEPPCIERSVSMPQEPALATFPLSRFHKPQRWFIDKSFDELTQMRPPEKKKDLSWITTDKGRYIPLGIRQIREYLLKKEIRKHESKDQYFLNGLSSFTDYSFLDMPTDGHILRMRFLESLTNRYPDLLDLYGYGSFSGEYYQGPVSDKWNGLAPYRYTLVVENYKGANYFSEKLTDALLSWCMPIYWGCTNLEGYLPKGSFIQIDIEQPDAPDRIREIVHSNQREANLDAIAKARQRLLEKYQIWPTVEQALAELNSWPN